MQTVKYFGRIKLSASGKRKRFLTGYIYFDKHCTTVNPRITGQQLYDENATSFEGFKREMSRFFSENNMRT